MRRDAGDDGVDVLEERREEGSRDGVHLEEAEREEDQPAIELSKVHVAEQADDVHGRRGDGVMGEYTLEHTAADIVADGGAALPAYNLRPEAFVSEALGGVLEGLAGDLEVQVEGGAVLGGRRGLVGVVKGGEAAEAGLDLALGGVCGHAQVGVVVGAAADLIVGFVDGVGEVGGDNEDVDDAAVGAVTSRARRRLGVAGADGDAVVDGLNPACHELFCASSLIVSGW